MGEEERVGAGIVEFATVVALNYLNRGAELRAHIREKIREDAKSVGHKAKRKSPGVVSAIIKNDEAIFIA